MGLSLFLASVTSRRKDSAEMKLSSALVVLMLFGCDVALSKKHFKLPRFGMFDKDGDGTITEDEAGQFIIDSGRALAMMAGKKIFRAIGYVSPSARNGEITKSEYKMMEDKIRDNMLDALERINGTMPMLKSRVMAGMKEWESRVIERVHRMQKMAEEGLECLEDKAQTFMEKIENYFEDPKA